MRRRWISPFDIWGAFTWRIEKKRSAEKPEETEKGEVRTVMESVGNGTENPGIILTASMIQKEPTPVFEKQLHERERYA